MFNEHYSEFMSLFWSRDTVYSCPPGLEITTRPPSEYCWKLIPPINAMKLLVNLAPGVIMRIRLRLLQLENCKIDSEFGTKSKKPKILGELFFFLFCNKASWLCILDWREKNILLICQKLAVPNNWFCRWLSLAAVSWTEACRNETNWHFNTSFSQSLLTSTRVSPWSRSHRSHQSWSLDRHSTLLSLWVQRPPAVSRICSDFNTFIHYCQNSRKPTLQSLAAGK